MLFTYSSFFVSCSPAGYDAIGELLFETIKNFDVADDLAPLPPQCDCTHKGCKDGQS